HLPEKASDLTLQDLRDRARTDLGGEEVVLEFSRDVIHKFVCPHCRREEMRLAPAGSVAFEAARCPDDGHLRVVETLHSFAGEKDLSGRYLHQLGLPLLDLFVARCGEREIGYIPFGDAEQVLGAAGREDAR